jgi:hypothetical protein
MSLKRLHLLNLTWSDSTHHNTPSTLMNSPILDSLLRCPHCQFEEKLRMPLDACVFFHECKGCRVVLRPKPGDCCVFCSYGTQRCPMMQVASPSERRND